MGTLKGLLKKSNNGKKHTAITLPAVRYEDVSVSRLKDPEYNPRIISEEAQDGLLQSITRWGLVEPIVWNERTGNIVGGKQRVSTLKKAGVTSATCAVINISEVEEKALNIALNNPAIQGQFDSDKLGDLLVEIKESLLPTDYDILMLGDLEADYFPEGLEEALLKDQQTDFTVFDTPLDDDEQIERENKIGKKESILNDSRKHDKQFDEDDESSSASVVDSDETAERNYICVMFNNEDEEREFLKLFNAVPNVVQRTYEYSGLISGAYSVKKKESKHARDKQN